MQRPPHDCISSRGGALRHDGSSMVNVMTRWTPLLVVAALAGTANAEEASSSPSPWIDLAPSEPSPSQTAEMPANDRRRVRFLAAAMLGMRGDQGGVISSGYRFVAIAGVILPQFSFSLAIDHGLGDDNRIPGASEPARFSEWIASARLGRAFRIGPDFWIQGALGLARVNTRVTRLDSMRATERANLGADAVATIVWRSGYIASTLVFGLTAIPNEEQVVIDGATYILPARVEPWFGLGVALLF
jgi:hypothetical protein